MSRRMLLIVNPYSGRGQIKTSILEIADVFVKAGFQIDLYTTQAKFDASQKAFASAAEYDLVVCCGGDGTVNEVVSGITLVQNAPPLGIITAGSTNDYGSSLGIPANPVEAAKQITGMNSRKIDTGLFNRMRFAYCAAFGMFTDVTYQTPQDLKNRIGWAAYIIEAIKNIAMYQPFAISLEYGGGVIEGEFILGIVSNTISIGGLRKVFDKVAQLDDGLLEVTLVKWPQDILEIQKAIQVLLSLEHLDYADNALDFLTFVSTQSLTIHSKSPIPWTLDGEDGGLHTEVSIETAPRSLNIICGDTDAIVNKL